MTGLNLLKVFFIGVQITRVWQLLPGFLRYQVFDYINFFSFFIYTIPFCPSSCTKPSSLGKQYGIMTYSVYKSPKFFFHTVCPPPPPQYLSHLIMRSNILETTQMLLNSCTLIDLILVKFLLTNTSRTKSANILRLPNCNRCF